MFLYYVNTNPQTNGDHEVHASACENVPNFLNRKFLGHFATCKEAVKEAMKTYRQSNCCKTCSDECYTT